MCVCVLAVCVRTFTHSPNPHTHTLPHPPFPPPPLSPPTGTIALTAFARARDVESGAFAPIDALTGRLRNGVNLVVTKTANKVREGGRERGTGWLYICVCVCGSEQIVITRLPHPPALLNAQPYPHLIITIHTTKTLTDSQTYVHTLPFFFQGVVGMAFRYHDATLGFCTAHMASDSNGKKRLRCVVSFFW